MLPGKKGGYDALSVFEPFYLTKRMNTLITPAQVVRLAFAPDDLLPPDAIAEADIAAAEARYLLPVLGQQLHERLLTDNDRSFVDHYLAAPLALFVRLLVQPRLDVRTGRTGTAAPKSDAAAPAPADARRAVGEALRSEARALLRRAVARIEAYPATFPEYRPDRNVLHRCSLHGKLVQVF